MPNSNNASASVDFGNMLGSAGIGTAFGAVDSAVGGLMNLANQAMQHHYWNKQYDKTRTDYLADRAHQEQYNSPAHQMELLAQAGLNPNLVYGKYQGAATSGTSAPSNQSPKGTSGFGTTGGIAGNIAAAAQLRQNQLQEESISARASLDRAQANYYNSMSPLWQNQVAQQIEESNARIRSIAQSISVGKSQEALNYAKEKESIAMKILHEADTKYRNGQYSLLQYQQNELIARTAMYTQQAHLYEDQSWLVTLQADAQEYLNDIQSTIRAMGGIEQLAESQLKTVAHELKILATKAKVEGNETFRWLQEIAPIVFEVDNHARAWYDSVNKGDRNSSGISAKQLYQIYKFMTQD